MPGNGRPEVGRRGQGRAGLLGRVRRETWQREVYEVQEGKWHLVSVENVEPRVAQTPASQ